MQKKSTIVWDKYQKNLMYHRWVHIHKMGYPVDWQSYEQFLRWCKATYEHGCRLIRIDDTQPYSQDNCRWLPIVNANADYRKQLAKRWDDIMTPIRERCAEQLREARTRKKEYFKYEHPDLVREGIVFEASSSV